MRKSRENVYLLVDGKRRRKETGRKGGRCKRGRVVEGAAVVGTVKEQGEMGLRLSQNRP